MFCEYNLILMLLHLNFIDVRVEVSTADLKNAIDCDTMWFYR